MESGEFNNIMTSPLMILFIGIIALIALYLTYFFYTKTGSTIFNMNDRDEKKYNELQALIRKFNAGDFIQNQQDKCPEQCPSGPPGANFQHQGVLRNLYIPDKVLDRTQAGKQIFLAKYGMAPNQKWTLSQGGKLENHYGQCISGFNDDRVEMKKCVESDPTQGWSWEKDGRITWKQDTNKCLVLEDTHTGLNVVDKILDGGFPIQVPISTTFQIVKLAICTPPDMNESRKQDFLKKQWFFD